MTISCPSCGASYRIEPEALGAGRKVRCARCRSEWDAAPGGFAGDDRPIEAIPPLDEAVAIDLVQRPGERADVTLDAVSLAQRRGPLRNGGLSSFRSARRTFAIRPISLVAAFAVAACGFLVGDRATMVRAAPGLASLYAAVGLPVNVRGLSIGDVRSVELIENGVPLLLVTGRIENVGATERPAPRLRLAVTDRDSRELYSWTTMASRASLAPGETSPFRARLASPPADGAAITVRFLASGDRASIAGR